MNEWLTWLLIVYIVYSVWWEGGRSRRINALADLCEQLERRVYELELDAAEELQCDGCGIWYDADAERCPACGSEELRGMRC